MKWTQDIRRVMYTRLYEVFGACSEWIKGRTNPTGNLEDYNQFLEDMAIGLSSITGNNCTTSAVKAQIAWGIQATQQSCVNKGAVTNFIYNRAIALEVGLITSADMPDCAEFGY